MNSVWDLLSIMRAMSQCGWTCMSGQYGELQAAGTMLVTVIEVVQEDEIALGKIM